MLPEGALSLLCGGAGSLLDHLTADDVVAFTGSSDTASRIRQHGNVLARGVSVNVEADSINAALLAPDVVPGTPLFDAFVKEVVREMTVKAGQKCTAIRRVFVPVAPGCRRGGAGGAASQDRGRRPAARGRAHGPGGDAGATARRPAGHPADRVRSRVRVRRTGRAKSRRHRSEKSSFVAPTLLRWDATGVRVHDTEVFGPAATVLAYRSEHEAFGLVARGGGSLVASVYGDDRDFLARAVGELGAAHGRLLAVDSTVADVHTGHGIVMPQCHHGGPGRAGNGEELGGLHGLRLYHQRVAVQGSAELIAALQAKAAMLH